MQLTKDDREIVVSARYQLLMDADGIERILDINRDVTERKQTPPKQPQSSSRRRLKAMERMVLTPIRRNTILSLLWRPNTCANLSIQPVLNPVFVVGIVRADVGLGPEGLRILANSTDSKVCVRAIFHLPTIVRAWVGWRMRCCLKAGTSGRGGESDELRTWRSSCRYCNHWKVAIAGSRMRCLDVSFPMPVMAND